MPTTSETTPLMQSPGSKKFYFEGPGKDAAPAPSAAFSWLPWMKPAAPRGFGVPKALPRKVPVKVDPKVYFANERTFMQWMHMAVLLSGAGTAVLSKRSEIPAANVYGFVLLPLAIAFLGYALVQFLRRGEMLRNRAAGPYDDLRGPIVLAALLLIAITTNFSVKVYDLLHRDLR